MGVTPFIRIRAQAAKMAKEREKAVSETGFSPMVGVAEMKLEELKAHAKENSIDIRGLKTKEEIINRISGNQPDGGESNGDGSSNGNAANSGTH